MLCKTSQALASSIKTVNKIEIQFHFPPNAKHHACRISIVYSLYIISCPSALRRLKPPATPLDDWLLHCPLGDKLFIVAHCLFRGTRLFLFSL